MNPYLLEFLVWGPGESREDACEIHASSPGNAAEIWLKEKDANAIRFGDLDDQESEFGPVTVRDRYIKSVFFVNRRIVRTYSAQCVFTRSCDQVSTPSTSSSTDPCA